MGMISNDEPMLLPSVEPEDAEMGDHPDEVDESEAERGHAVYLAVDDLDDDSTGLEP